MSSLGQRSQRNSTITPHILLNSALQTINYRVGVDIEIEHVLHNPILCLKTNTAFFSFQGDTSRHWGVGQRVYEPRGSDSHQEEELQTLHPHHAGRSREKEHQTVMDHLK